MSQHTMCSATNKNRSTKQQKSIATITSNIYRELVKYKATSPPPPCYRTCPRAPVYFGKCKPHADWPRVGSVTVATIPLAANGNACISKEHEMKAINSRSSLWSRLIQAKHMKNARTVA
ncbi:hypothetical protein CBL_07724 [Carabus blaptoides fortunei]